jgi:hypothetical protein
MDDKMLLRESVASFLQAGTAKAEKTHITGHYEMECTDAEGHVIWTEAVDNVVTTAGKNAILAEALQGSAYTVTGPFMLLISSASFSTIVAADTMSSHAGWLEAGATNSPHYSGTRPTVTFSSPSGGSIVSTGTNSFAFTNSGTVQGVGMVYGTGATGTIDSTAGTLLSAGTLGAAQPVISGNTVTATYTLSL